jgi:hypothetical protein
MMKLEYHKGSFCSYLSAFCQEGYRGGCEVCLKSKLYPKTGNAETWTATAKKPQEMAGANMKP